MLYESKITTSCAITRQSKFYRTREDDDDLSRLPSANDEHESNTTNATKQEKHNMDSPKEKQKDGSSSSAHLDIRSKYGKKLRKKVEGGLSGANLANTKKKEALQRADAASHLAARTIALMDDVQASGSRWLANSGTGSLLSFLSMRSVKIALMPSPQQMDESQIIKNNNKCRI